MNLDNTRTSTHTRNENTSVMLLNRGTDTNNVYSEHIYKDVKKPIEKRKYIVALLIFIYLNDDRFYLYCSFCFVKEKTLHIKGYFLYHIRFLACVTKFSVFYVCIIRIILPFLILIIFTFLTF